ncbi:hypothetical protein M4D55_23345 [Metabacillus idriensis]|uniref:hypothetical protein n=1 Tax=Metabacillus idriensis TaxID=324768 RepID=UPI00203C640B|nr:hypothetical protein [Metabacillus idriensis]MCM3598698.1 hypothetical protein [Metabacillus idriensis]
MRYRKKPMEVEAIKLESSYSSILQAIEFVCSKEVSNGLQGDPQYLSTLKKNGGMYINNPKGIMKVSFGDYIIKSRGEVYPCKPDIFEMTYEQVEAGYNV